MAISTQTSPSPQAPLLTLLLLITFPLVPAEDMDSTGKKITIYPSSLMLSHNVKPPLLFFSDTRVMYLTTRLRPISPGPSLHILNNCSIPQNGFFNSLLHSIHSTHKVITRLLSMSSFSNLIECSMSKSLSVSQSLFRLFNGKLVYSFKTTDTLTTRTNQLYQDLPTIDHTFSLWQSKCHESILLEFFSKHSNTVNRAFVALLCLTEIQDVLHQFAALETKTLFGFPHLPPFLHPQILTQFTTDMTKQYTAKALDEGFPLFINPMVDIEHEVLMLRLVYSSLYQ